MFLREVKSCKTKRDLGFLDQSAYRKIEICCFFHLMTEKCWFLHGSQHEMSGTRPAWLFRRPGGSANLTIIIKNQFSYMPIGLNNPDIAWIWLTLSELGERMILRCDRLRPEFGAILSETARQISAEIGDRGTP